MSCPSCKYDPFTNTVTKVPYFDPFNPTQIGEDPRLVALEDPTKLIDPTKTTVPTMMPTDPRLIALEDPIKLIDPTQTTVPTMMPTDAKLVALDNGYMMVMSKDLIFGMAVGTIMGLILGLLVMYIWSKTNR